MTEAPEPAPPLRRLAREPLVHFLLLGAALAALGRWLPRGGPGPAAAKPTILVTRGKIEQLAEIWTRTRMRPPTPGELRGIVDEHVREEVLYREALALRLDEDDTVVRRRLAQKMGFLAEGLAEVAEPTDEALRALLDAEPERFREPLRVSFRQVFVSPDERGAGAAARARALLETLRSAGAPEDLAQLGDPLLLPQVFDDVALDESGRLFGGSFAREVEAAEVGAWTGPVSSGYGLHLLLVTERTPALAPELDAVREDVRQEWLARERQRVEGAFYAALRERYRVVVEEPEAPGDGAGEQP